MAKIQGPLLSMGGLGQIGHSQVYATWKGRPYVRRYVIPANPKSTEQTKTRTAFTWLVETWKTAPLEFQASWTAFAKGKVLTNRNAWLSKGVKKLRPQGGAALTTLLGLPFSPGAAGGIAANVVIVDTAGDLVFTADPPDPLPAGWSVVGFTGAAILEQDPQTDLDTAVLVAAAADPGAGNPWVATITGPTAGTYATAGWFIYQRSAIATDLAYGPANATLTVVA